MTDSLSKSNDSNSPKLPTGNPKDFKVKTCLHSVSYGALWGGQAFLTVDKFITKASELGFDGVELGTNARMLHCLITIMLHGKNYVTNLNRFALSWFALPVIMISQQALTKLSSRMLRII